MFSLADISTDSSIVLLAIDFFFPLLPMKREQGGGKWEKC